MTQTTADSSGQRSDPAGVVDDGDHARLNETLELAAARCDDLTPLVFQRFFARRPGAVELFSIPDPQMPPLGCGQMLYELICLLLDGAAGQTYVGAYMQGIAEDHRQHRVLDRALYQDFLAALADVVAGLLGADWCQAHAEAWERQSESLLDTLPAF